MNAFSYLVSMSVKNMIRQTLKKPGLAIVYIALIIFLIVGVRSNPDSSPFTGASPDVWKALALVYFAAQFYVVLRGALTKGTTVFGMDDVQLLFTAPIRMQTVLLYGVVRQMGKSLLIPLFLLFQIPNLKNLLGMRQNEMIALFVAMFLMAFIAQVISVCVYALMAENARTRSNVVKAMNVLAAVFVAAGAYALATGGPEAAIKLYSGGAWGYVPLIGWLRAAMVAAEGGNALVSALLILASLALAAPPLLAVWKKQPDFYEDVLDVTQQRHELQQLAKSGNKQDVAIQRMKVRLGRTGLGRGRGAAAFFYKQLLEQRRMGVMFLDMWTLINVGVVAAICYFMGVTSSNGNAMPPDLIAYIALGTLCYIQMVFNVSTGHYASEKKRQFLFLAPCGPRGKLLMCNLIGAFKAALDAMIAFFIASLVTPVGAFHVPLAALLCALLSLLFTGAQLLSDWLVGERHSKLLGMMLFFLIAIVLIVPATALFIIMSNYGAVAAYLSASAYASLAVFILYMPLGGLLHDMDVE